MAQDSCGLKFNTNIIHYQLSSFAYYVTRSGKIQHFAESIKIEILLHYLASVMSESYKFEYMSIYNYYCTISELQHFVMQPLIFASIEGSKSILTI